MATYGSTSGVQALMPETTTFSESSTPSVTQVGVWLAEGYAKINRALTTAGYSAPVATSAALHTELTGLENLYAAAYALRALGMDTATGETDKTSEVWLRDFYSQLKDIAASNLALVGAVLLPSSTPTRRRRLRTLQMRKVDGYARGATAESYEVRHGEYTGPTAPAE